jgi:hypothetical protein
MPVSVLSSLRELGIGAQRFLIFTAANQVAWQCVAGLFLVLFGRAINMPESWVGVLQAFMPLSTVLVAFTVPLVERTGPRRLLLFTWGIRNVLAIPTFAMVWAMSVWGPQAAWYVLLLSTLSFCGARAIGVGGWFPWLYEVVPNRSQGIYFATEAATAQLTNIALTLAVAFGLRGNTGLGAYFWIYLMGILAGFVSLAAIWRIPGGKQLPQTTRTSQPGLSGYRHTLADRDYVRYVLRVCLGQSALWWLQAVYVLYLRDQLKFSDTQIMYQVAAGSLGMALTVRQWGRYADRFGSIPAIMFSLAAYALIGLGWITLLPGAVWTPALSLILVVLGNIFNGAALMVMNRGMLCRVREKGRVGYTNLWIVCTALATGITPILAGVIVQWLQLTGFRICFLLTAVMSVACALSLFSVAQEQDKPPVPNLTNLLKPSIPMRTLWRIVWITLGLDESNRSTEEEADGPAPDPET